MALKIYFGSLATEYITASGRTIQDVAEEIGNTPKNQFYKWRSGKWTYIAEAKLRRVIDVVARRDRDKRVNLQIAYLIDMMADEFRPLIDITPRTGEAEGNPLLTGQRWSPTLREKLEAIGAAYSRDRDFMRMADNMGEWAKGINAKAGK
jgi:hypothetical protein